MHQPLVYEIDYEEPHRIFAQFAEESHVVFLDSAQPMLGCGRFSFIAVDPFLTMQNVDAPWADLQEQLAKFVLTPHPDLPPFQGGVAGLFSYDLHQHAEKIFSTQQNDVACPDLAVGFYDLVIGFDGLLKRAFIFSSGFPVLQESERKLRAQERLSWLLGKIACSKKSKPTAQSAKIKINANFTQEEYCRAVEKVKNYILDGDIFEANISQRFDAEWSNELSAFDLYCQLRIKNPAPFSAYLSFDDLVIASASPERFLKVSQRAVETRPIKGTRARGQTTVEDQRLADELCSSKKDRAENIMIVDLMRNDLSRVCEPGSVQVPQLCGLESYQSVHHLVSVVTGKLMPQYHALDLLRVAFPGGSVTGAPKIRAMEIIAEIEPTCRGAYCGSIGYIGFDGAMDTSIVIRTFVIKKNRILFQAGGAVTLGSDPLLEYEETLTKANALRAVLHDFVN